MRVSLYTTCMGRLHHIRETLPRNLEDNQDFPNVEFVLLDYNSQDGLEQWVFKTMAPAIKSGRLTYWRERASRNFNGPRARNIAACVATGDIVVNVDGDNFTGKGYARKIAGLFEQDPAICVRSPVWASFDVWGRVALRREDFHKLRGYDETLRGWGYDDVDLINRAHRLKLRVVQYLHPGSCAIGHANNERVCYSRERLSPIEFSHQNAQRVSSRPPGPLNPNGYGAACLLKNFSNEPVRVIWGSPSHSRAT